MNIVILENFNNYYNRIVKKHNTLADYLSNQGMNKSLRINTNVAFNPNDGVDTVQVINFPVPSEGTPTDVFTPDYLIVVDDKNNDTIISRWFVTDFQYNCNRQYTSMLHRDCIADNYNSIIAANSFIERGICKEIKSSGATEIHPYLVNQENVKYNQQKQSQNEIKDIIGCPWIIGYIAPDSSAFHYKISCGTAEPYYEFQLRIKGKNINNVDYWGFYNQEANKWVYTQAMGGSQITYDDKELSDASTLWPFHSYIDAYTYVNGKAVYGSNVEVDINANIYTPDIPDCTDAPYNLFAIPYGDIGIYNNSNDGTPTFLNTKELGFSMAEMIQTQLTSANIYDLQLIPYCPIKEFITKEKVYYNNIPHTFIENDYGLKMSIIFYPKKSKFETTISYPITINNTPLDYKKEACLTTYRLTSQNYTSSFDFNLGYLGGSLTGFKVKCTLKPINSTIQVKPYPYKGIYATNEYTDENGLIIQGDLSIPQMSDPWQTYEYQNKNYDEIFKSGLKSQAIDYQYSMVNTTTNALAAMFGGSGSSAAAGYSAGRMNGTAKTGAVVGAIGAIGNAIGTAIGSIGDIKASEKVYKDQLAIQIQQQEYQRANITAQSQSISNIGAFSNISQLFPILVKYSATSEEATIFENYLTWNGWNIGIYDSISNWLGGMGNQKFFRGSMLRNESLKDDTHMFNSINDELQKGVYI